MRSLIQYIELRLIAVEKAIASLSLFLLLLLSVTQILVRNILDFGFPEIEIINRNLLVVCGAMGAVIATSRLRHIKIDALTPLLSTDIRNRLRAPLALFSTLVCAALCYYAIIFCIDEWQYTPVNERWTLPFTLIYPLGFCLLGFHFFALNFRKPEQ